MSDNIKLILGTMTFGPQVDKMDAEKMVNKFIKSGYYEIDTAFVYNNGSSEEILGNALKDVPKNKYSIATKVNPRITQRLDGEAINMQICESLRRLSLEAVDILYLHFPDPNTPIENTLEACAELYQKNKFKELGLSNFPAHMVVDVYSICKKNGWPIPTVYQGVYNGLSRKAESELFPTIRKLKMRFYAYNPLAGGILSGRYSKYTDNPDPGRFTYRSNYMNRYWKESYFEAYSLINNQCKEEGITIIEAAYRWLIYHSLLDSKHGDGVIVGASKLEQLEQNLDIGKSGPLPQTIVDTFEQGWKKTKIDSPEYYRFVTEKLLEEEND